ncbi:MAG: hypothetical protein IPK83_23445, partial [Planctomycetes bacterium]|nr:hypothetical protein [Planctomycetota bacterium]
MDAAIAALERAAKIEPNCAATPYLWGLALAHKTEFEKAVPKFEEAARLDAATPAVRFQLALAYQAAGRDKEAMTQFKETARLDLMHAAAWFKLATYARQAGDAAEAQRCTREFTRLRKLFGDTGRNAETLESCVHTKAEAVGEATTRPAEGAKGIEVKFVDASKSAFAKDDSGVRA